MQVYFGITLIAYLISFAGIRLEAKLQHSNKIACICVALLFCALAGARDVTVGTDTAGYGVGSFVAAESQSFVHFFLSSDYSSWSPLYKALTWIVVNLSHSLFWYLFAVELLIVAPVLWASKRLLQNYYPVAVAVFGILFFPMSFNMMRQMIAMSFLLSSYVWLENRSVIGFIVLVVAAAGFHNSAWIGLLVYPLYIFGNQGYFSAGIKLTFFSLVTIALLYFSPQLLSWFTETTGYYSVYVSGSYADEAGGLRPCLEILVLFTVISSLGMCLLWKVPDASRDKTLNHLSAIVLFGVIVFFLSVSSLWLYRIGMIFLYYSVLLIPEVIRAIPRKPEKVFFIAVTFALLLIFAYDYYEVQGSHEVIPYLISKGLY